MNNEKGFTLIEIIATLVIMGFITVTAATGIVHAVKAYIFARQNAAISQNTNYALSRITAELMLCTSISKAKPKVIKYETIAGGLDGDTTRTVNLNNTNAKINGKFLLDNLSLGSSLSYRKFDDSAWTTSDDFSELAAIDVVLVVGRPGNSGDTYSFNTSITMRNNDVPNAPFPGT